MPGLKLNHVSQSGYRKYQQWIQTYNNPDQALQIKAGSINFNENDSKF